MKDLDNTVRADARRPRVPRKHDAIPRMRRHCTTYVGPVSSKVPQEIRYAT